MELSKLTNKEMKAVLQALKDKTSGSKQELILRLQKYDEEVLKRTISEIHERSIQIDNDDLNESHDADGGAGSVSQLRMEVANLTATVHALMQQLQDKTSTQSNSDTHIAQQKQDDTSKQSNSHSFTYANSYCSGGAKSHLHRMQPYTFVYSKKRIPDIIRPRHDRASVGICKACTLPFS